MKVRKAEKSNVPTVYHRQRGKRKIHPALSTDIQESLRRPSQKFLVIVPEQFTMQTQKEFVRLHPSHAIMNIDILSFERLAYRVFDELGTDTLTVLEETGKNLASAQSRQRAGR